MGEAEVISFVMGRPELNLELKKNNPKLFNAMIVATHIIELKRGFKVEKIYKTTKKGTSFKYIKIKSSEELDKYMNYIDNLMNFVNETNNLNCKFV